MSFEELQKRFSGEWTAIDKAKAAADEQVRRLNEMLVRVADAGGSVDSDDVNFVIFGSLARGEWTSGSDLDWTLLIDGVADHEHANTAHHVSWLLEKDQFKKPGRTGTFGK